MMFTRHRNLYFSLPVICSALLALLGCATSDLSNPDYSGAKARLVLYPMASSDTSTRCVIAAIDGQDVRDRQSWRLTTEYLIPAGQRTYGFVCEESSGSIAARGYSFDLVLPVSADGNYGLLQQRGAKAICILVQEMDNDPDQASVLAKYCLQQ